MIISGTADEKAQIVKEIREMCKLQFAPPQDGDGRILDLVEGIPDDSDRMTP